MKQWIGAVALGMVLVFSGCVQQEGILPREVVFEGSDSGQMKVMTFNLRTGAADDGADGWAFRRELVFDVLAEHRADVIGLQEVESFQMDQIRRAIPQYKIVAAGRDDGKTAGEACPVLFRRDRFTLVDSGTFWFSNSPWKAGSTHWGNQTPRICTWVQLTETGTNGAFYVFNVHLDHQSQTSRIKSTELLAKEIAHRIGHDPFIVLGDFNMGLDNPAMLYLQAIGYDSPCPRLVDSWQMLNRNREPVGTYHGFKGDPVTTKIDHVLVPDDTEIIEVGIDQRNFDGRYPSDHFPVYARITLR